MSYRDLIAGALNTAFASMGDLKSTVTYTEPGSSYDPTTGTMTAGTEHTVTQAVVADFALGQIDGTVVQSADRQVIINAADLSVTPESGASVTIDGVRYEVVAVVTDPAGASHTLQVRR